MNKKIQSREEYFIQFTDEEMEKLGIKGGEKFSVQHSDDGSIKLIPFAKLELDFSEFSREMLEFLIRKSCDKDVSVNEIISDILKEMVSFCEGEDRKTDFTYVNSMDWKTNANMEEWLKSASKEDFDVYT